MAMNDTSQSLPSDVLESDATIVTWSKYMDGLEWGPGHRDETGYNSFIRAGGLGVDPDFAIKEVARRIKATGGKIDSAKIKRQIKRAYEYVGTSSGPTLELAKPPKTQFSLEKLTSVASRVSPIDEQWLASKSILDPSKTTSAQFLDSLYNPGEKIVIFTVFESKGQFVYEVGLEQPPHPIRGMDGVWFLSNPVDGLSHPNPRQENKLSRRSEESITSWRYLVLESDVASSDLWLRALVQLPLKISAIYTSGGKSIHALVRLDAASKTEWDKLKDKIKPIVVILGADPNALTAVRLTRLPGTKRWQTPQKLLYINPNADGTPIEKLKERINP